jgi:hypothetical protein
MRKPTSKQIKDKKGRLMISMVLFLSACIFGVALLLHKSAIARSRIDGCPLDDREISGVDILLVDASDPLTLFQQQLLGKTIDRMQSSLQPEEQVIVYKLTEEGGELLAPVFEGCSLDNGKKANLLYENPELIQKNFEKNFSQPLKDRFSKIELNNQMKTSPIIEAINLAAQRMEGNEVKHKKLIVMSDMLQNSSMGSQYSQHSLDQKKAFSLIKGHLQGVEVQVVYLSNGKSRQLQTDSHQRFWKEFFKAGGAKSVRFFVV